MNEKILIEITPEDLQALTFALGCAAGRCSHREQSLAARWLRLANTINAKTPNWLPFDVEARRAD